MTTVNTVIIVESVRGFLDHTGDELNKLHIPAVASVATALFVKLVLFFYCLGVRKHSSQVEVLWEDHRNDLVLNTFGALSDDGYVSKTIY